MLKAVATPSENAVFPGDIFVPSPGTSTQIQAAMDAVFAANMGTKQIGTVQLQPGGVYTISTGLILQIENVSFNGNGAVLDASTLSNSGTALTITNTKGPPTDGSFVPYGGQVMNFYLNGDSTASGANYNTMRGIHIEGTPDLNSYTLNGTINSSATSFAFSASTSLPPAPFTVKIDNEDILIGTLSGTAASNCTRGYLGSTANGHTSGATILTWHQAHPQISNVDIHFFNKAISIGDSSFVMSVDNFALGNNYYHIYAAATTNTAQAENIRFYKGDIYDGTVGLYAEHQILRFDKCSFDYNNRQLDIELGSAIECYGCHFEWNYGQTAGQTNSPFFITGADCFLLVQGGMMTYTGSGLWFYPSHFYSDNASQYVQLRDVRMANLGKFRTATSDDVLVMNADPLHFTGNVGTTHITGSYSALFTVNDFPSTTCYVQQGNWLRNGVGDPYTELRSRITLTGTCAIATQAGSDGTVTPKSGSQMMKITGAGTVIITFPQFYQPMIKNTWSFFMNGAEIGGTVTVTERQVTVHPVWNGSSSLTFTEDTRTSTTGTYTFPSAGTNQWTRVSWKDMSSTSQVPSPRMFDYWAIIIDTTAMTGTNLYLDTMSLTQV